MKDLLSTNSIKTLVITGPTATGKTTLALKLAKLFPADLISADSRQVYTSLNLIPGKDIPSSFHKKNSSITLNQSPIPIYTNNKTSIYGYDLVDPNQPWNLNFFHQFAWKVIIYVSQQKRLPIIVGGTGLYIDTLFNPTPNTQVPPNPILRARLEKLSINKLQNKLLNLSPEKFNSLNHSDQHNPRRLIRAIEILSSSVIHPKSNHSSPQLDCLKIALTAPLSTLEKNITKRVKQRLNSDYLNELNILKSIDPDLKLPASSALGYQILSDFHQKKITRQQATTLWVNQELNYAKRQLTWLRAQSNYHWIDISPKNHAKQVVDLVTRWYSETNHDRYTQPQN